MAREAIVAAIVAASIGMGTIKPQRYMQWIDNVQLRWLVPVVGVQAVVFAASGVAGWGLADWINVDGFEDKWVFNGCLWGVGGYVLLGVQLNAFGFDKLSAAWMPLRFVANFGLDLLDHLAVKRIESLTDAELEQRAMSAFWRELDPLDDVESGVKTIVHRNLVDACAQLRDPQHAADGRGRLRVFVQWAMTQNVAGRRGTAPVTPPLAH